MSKPIAAAREFWRRLTRYGQIHGPRALARRALELATDQVLKFGALALLYYPAVLLGHVRWTMRRRPTVLGLVPGSRRFGEGRVAVFLIWQPRETPWYVWNVLDAMAAVRTDVLLVVNHPLGRERLDALRARCAQIMIRDNTGLDIGAYKDAVAHLSGQADISRVVFLNDSVYYFGEALPRLFGRLVGGGADLVAPYENSQFYHHVQSFCFSVSRRLFDHPAFRRFWSDYAPLNSRRWAIHAGEVALSRVMLEAATSIDILYRADAIPEAIGASADADARGLADLLPITLRRRLANGSTGPSGREIAALVAQGSQVHTGGFLFRRFFDAPVLKRDLVFRQQFTPEEVADLLDRVGHEGHRDEILAEIGRKGSSTGFTGLQRGRYIAGLV